jgi:hypothetical protein
MKFQNWQSILLAGAGRQAARKQAEAGIDFGSYSRNLKHNSDTSLERCDRTAAFLGL